MNTKPQITCCAPQGKDIIFSLQGKGRNIFLSRETSHLDVPQADTTHVQYAAWGAQDNQLVSPASASLYLNTYKGFLSLDGVLLPMYWQSN